MVAELRGALRGTDDVGKEHGRQHRSRPRQRPRAGQEGLDLVGDAVDLVGEDRRPGPLDLGERRIRQRFREGAGAAQRQDRVAGPVQDEDGRRIAGSRPVISQVP